ncbi:hypothetical protein [Antrihabitans cavernicola]|uniref:Uncharacterized protein n=1 Tax=Antrihabitans cavernicola TaxID=2495913 RepID=A0A5A7SA78_9NOCA|nr:hypothetical protein [Spelaeibacter cavernicola]KAA0021435.1 hypothetical protein FOY51_19570 [Spelaeibacter cavernicola]
MTTELSGYYRVKILLSIHLWRIESIMITRGAHYALIGPHGQRTVFEVKAIRYSPFPYAELEPSGGGNRRVVHLADLQRDLDDAKVVKTVRH